MKAGAGDFKQQKPVYDECCNVFMRKGIELFPIPVTSWKYD